MEAFGEPVDLVRSLVGNDNIQTDLMCKCDCLALKAWCTVKVRFFRPVIQLQFDEFDGSYSSQLHVTEPNTPAHLISSC